jgi:FkbM family methyltransferase
MHSGVHSYWLGNYEPDTVQTLSEWVKPGMVCYDCGANAGYFTLLLSKLAGPSGRVLAFEPVPRNAAHVRRHIEMNQCVNASVQEMALSNHAGTIRFQSGGSMGKISESGDLEVLCGSLDGLNLPAPDLMKIDVEGAELMLLAGAWKLLQQKRPALLISLHIPEKKAEECAASLRSIGYDTELCWDPYELRALPADQGSTQTR